MIPLSEHAIREQLGLAGYNSPIQIHILDTVDSTNRYLKEISPHTGLTLCCAESQTQGRGRFNRHWFSPKGENITLSLRLALGTPPAFLSTLGLVVSLALHATLNTLGFKEDITIKWPNDLLWQQKKLAGCLIELIPSTTNPEVIIGIGLNVNSNTSAYPSLGRAWCSLYEITQQLYDRNLIIGLFLTTLKHDLNQWLTQGFSPFMTRWRVLDELYGKFISVSQGAQMRHGTAKGITELGELILLTCDGKKHNFSSGDTTIHRE